MCCWAGVPYWILCIRSPSPLLRRSCVNSVGTGIGVVAVYDASGTGFGVPAGLLPPCSIAVVIVVAVLVAGLLLALASTIAVDGGGSGGGSGTGQR